MVKIKNSFFFENKISLVKNNKTYKKKNIKKDYFILFGICSLKLIKQWICGQAPLNILENQCPVLLITMILAINKLCNPKGLAVSHLR